MKKLLYLGFAILLLATCGKEEVKQKLKTDLPHFGNVNLEKISEKSPPFENKEQVTKYLHRYYQNIWESSDMSGGILVANSNDILLEKYKGFGRENEQMPITQDTPLHIASVSKPLTAMVVLKLVEAEKLSLEQRVTSIFPDFPYEQVTVFHLLSHRSGLPKYEHFLEEAKYQSKKYFVTNREVLDFMVKYKPALAKDTGKGFMYCNTNYALLALIIEEITKKTFPQAMREMLFEPLEMKNTFIFQEKDIDTAAQSFYQKGNKLYPLNELDLIYGDKNVYTTPRDLLRFSRAMFSEDFLPKNLMDKVFFPYSNEKKGVNNYGLGFRLKIFDSGKKLVYHNGWWHGSNTVFIHLRDSKTTIIALGNKYSRKIYSAVHLSSLFEEFPFEIEKILASETPNLENISE